MGRVADRGDPNGDDAWMACLPVRGAELRVKNRSNNEARQELPEKVLRDSCCFSSTGVYQCTRRGFGGSVLQLPVM